MTMIVAKHNRNNREREKERKKKMMLTVHALKLMK